MDVTVIPYKDDGCLTWTTVCSHQLLPGAAICYIPNLFLVYSSTW
jgi:hypothetical protein